MDHENSNSFPEAVGKTGEEAKAIILAKDSSLQVVVLQENSPCTKDYRTNRVRVFVDANGIV